MCGIAGFYGYRDDKLIKKFSEQLSHRGPDGEGYYINDNVTLLNRRLAIIDRKGGDQPIYNEEKSIVVTYNGEIYNFQDLRDKLKKAGHRFSTKSDTEVIVHGYEEWGDICFDRFNGMFAVALYDIKNEKLILARDHFGIKPLYYSLISTDAVTKRLLFSSEIKPLVYSGLIDKKPNDKVIYRYLKYRVHDDQKETFFDGVYRLMPGEMLIIQNLKLEIKKYTKLEEELVKLTSFHPRGGNVLLQKDIVGFKKRLIEAIRLRLISEVPVGTCLSGGLDSSTVVATVNKLLSEKVKEAASVGKIQKTFSAVFPGSSNDEEVYINELVKNLKTKIECFKIYPKPEEFFNEINEFLMTQEEPLISSGHYAQYKVMQKVHEYVTVVLDGQGSDEMTAGYLPYYYVYLKQLWRQNNYLKLIKESLLSIDVIKNALINQLIKAIGIKKNINVDNLMNAKFSNKYQTEKFESISDNLKKRLIQDVFYNSVQSLLRYEDRNAMHFSIEGRVPFLDFNLIKYLFSLPDEAIIKNGWNKYILRQSIKDLLPEKIVNRRNKIGFTTPEYEWFMRMKNKIYQIFLSESFTKRKYFNQQEIIKAFQLFIEGKTDDTMLFWRLLNLELWLRIFFDPPSPAIGGIRRDKLSFEANEGKKIEIKVGKKDYFRFPIKTKLVKKGENVEKLIASQIVQSINRLDSYGKFKHLKRKSFFVAVSEKIVAIAQGRSYFIWDIKPSNTAKILSNYVKKTPYGIGLGSPWTMQLAIDDVGLPKIIFATIVSGITKLFGVHGMFYRIVGKEIAAIDGPTEYSLYPSNVSAKLGPKEPQKVAEKINKQIVALLNGSIVNNFLGVVIIDANDLGQTVLGNSTPLKNELIEKIFSDNPMGQADEQTPITIVFEKK